MSFGSGLQENRRWLWPLSQVAADKRRDGKSKLTEAGTKTGAIESAGAKAQPKHADSFRETVESVVIAFVLAFLFRTFLAEAFVIPTGSMAPTLMGRHKDFACKQCGHHYTVGASDEVDKESSVLINRLTNSVCPNCNFTNDIYESNVFNGDRILVNKFPYELSEPDRFDVFVFRYPEDPQTNYIKRLVGLPGESLKIDRGDLYARKGDSGEFQILRKQNPKKQKIVQQVVYDDDQPPTALLKQNWPERWAAMDAGTGNGSEWVPADKGFQQDAAQRSFQVDAGGEWNWLRYRHLVPTEQDWDLALEGQAPSSTPRPQLIADFCGYNVHRSKQSRQDQDWQPDLLWVGDLALDATLDIKKISGDSPAAVLELIEGVRRYRCEFDLKSGTVTLQRTDELKGDNSFATMATSPSGIKGTGRHTVSFANVDDRLCLWIDGRLISFGPDADYTPPAIPHPQQADLHPVGLAVRDVSATVSQLVIHRDIYYRAVKSPRDNDGEGSFHFSIGRECARLLHDPEAYGNMYFREPRSVEFEALDDDEYFAMGDNSTRSYDGRLWHPTRQSHHAHAVNRRALIGKAFFIYWPHGIPFLNQGKGFPVMMHQVADRSNVENYPLYTAPFYPQWWRWKRIQ